VYRRSSGVSEQNALEHSLALSSLEKSEACNGSLVRCVGDDGYFYGFGCAFR
jgi:hypothetical protein